MGIHSERLERELEAARARLDKIKQEIKDLDIIEGRDA